MAEGLFNFIYADFDDDGKAKAIVEEATDEANDAASNCPAQAIEVE